MTPSASEIKQQARNILDAIAFTTFEQYQQLNAMDFELKVILFVLALSVNLWVAT
jgi:hypothetical protein